MNEQNEVDEQGERHLAVVGPRARFHITLGALQAALEDEPSPRAVRSCLRRWIGAATQVAEDVIRDKQTKQGGDQ